MKKRTFILFVVMGLLEASNMACGQIITVPDTLSKYILTPKAPDTPRINGAMIFGIRPGSPFLYTIPATGIRPMFCCRKSAQRAESEHGNRTNNWKHKESG